MLGPAIFEDATYIFNHILLGTQEMAFNREELLMTGITHICNCAEQIPNYFEGEFVYMKINLVDKTTEEILPHFQPVSNFLKRVETLGGRALIHCVAGVSRSPALLIAHLMIDKKMRLYDAYRFVKKKRSTILPNTSFRLQLAKYEIMLFGKSSVDTTEDPEWNFFAWNEIKNSVRLR
jgi:hypothetical protein